MHEAEIQTTPEGDVPADTGWFVRNLGELAWEAAAGFGAWKSLGVGLHVHVFQPGESNGYYHAEDADEGFLVLSGECVAIIENQERRLRQWDLFHSPAGTAHITVGAGDGPCAILMFGSPDPSRDISWIANDLAAQHGASVAKTTSVDTEVYTDLPPLERIQAPKPFG
jgi:uncharacterized cupin superfamily protein